jgi:hypothetical protein
MNEQLRPWIERGFKILPIVPNGKEAWIKEWPEKASSDPATIEAWESQFPNCNWAVACGASGLVVVDQDNRNGGAASFAKLEEELGLPFTLTVATTSGGYHYYYSGLTRSRTSMVPGIDIKSDRGYVLIPPSVIGGKPYTLADDFPIQPLPEQLKEMIGVRVKLNLPLGELDDNPDALRRGALFLRSASPAIEGSGGNNHTFRVAAGVRDFGVSESMAFEMMLDIWNPECMPPWEPEELATIVRNAYKHAQLPAGNKSISASGFVPVRSTNSPIPISEIGFVNPPREWVAEGWIPKGPSAFTLFAGEGGAGKSLLMLQLGIAVSTGTPWLGLPTSQMPVLMVSCEDDITELDRRFYAIRKSNPFLLEHKNPPFCMLPRVGKENVLCLSDQSSGLAKQGPFFKELEYSMGEMGASSMLLILDTLSDVYSGNENDRSLVNSFVKSILGKLSMKYNATIILVSHPAKNKESTYSGSSAWNNSVRNRTSLSWAKEEDCTSKYRELKSEKSNYAELGTKMVLEYKGGMLVPVDAKVCDLIVGEALYEAIVEAVEKDEPLHIVGQSPNRLEKASIFDSKGKKIPVAMLKANYQSLKDAGRIVVKTGSKHKKNGIYPAD